MPDTMIADLRVKSGLSLHELIRRERVPLPSHELSGTNYRAWAAAVCDAEFAHRSRDFARVEGELDISIDYYAYPNCVEWGQFKHEAYACAALNWLSHLQAHESEKRTPFFIIRPFREWRAKDQAKWIARRRYLWAGFLNAVRNYKAARSELDAFLEEVK